MLFPREPQEPCGCGVDEAEEVGSDIEHLGEGAKIGRPHVDAKRMQGDGPGLSRKPTVASHLGGDSQGWCAGVSRELKHDQFGLRDGGTLRLLVLPLKAGLVSVPERCVELLVPRQRRNVDVERFSDRADGCAGLRRMLHGLRDGAVVVVLECPAALCPFSGPECLGRSALFLRSLGHPGKCPPGSRGEALLCPVLHTRRS